MGAFIGVTSGMGKLTAMVSSSILSQTRYTKGNGSTISHMAEAQRNGMKVNMFTKDSLKMDKRQVKASLPHRATFTREIF